VAANKCLVPARPARRDKVLDEVSAAIPGDASRRERRFSAGTLFALRCKSLVSSFTFILLDILTHHLFRTPFAK
jgi:hypothetical protein